MILQFLLESSFVKTAMTLQFKELHIAKQMTVSLKERIPSSFEPLSPISEACAK